MKLRAALRARVATRTDFVVAALVAVGAFAWHYRTAISVLPHDDDLAVVGADTARVVRHMSVRAPMLDRGQFHPLFALITQPIERSLTMLGVDRFHAVRVVIATYGALMAAGVYALARPHATRWIAAGLAVMSSVSAAASVFFAIPETFGVAAALLVWTFVVFDRWRDRPALALAVTSVVAPAAVVSGVVAPLTFGALSVRSSRGWLRAIAASATAFVVLLLVQRIVAGTHFGVTVDGETQFSRGGSWQAVGRSVRTLVRDVWVLPRWSVRHGVATIRDAGWAGGAGEAAGGLVGAIGLAVGCAVTCAAAAGAVIGRRDRVVQTALVVLIADVALAAVYGDEPFLFAALLLAPLAVLLVAAARQWPRAMTALLVVAVPLTLVANGSQMQALASILGS